MPTSPSGSIGSLVGGSLSSYASCFSGDDKLLCVPCENSVKLYSVSTGEQVGLLAGISIGSDPDSNLIQSHDGSLVGHTRTITTVMSHPSNRVQLYTASLDGTIKLWDLYDQTCVATYPIRVASAVEETKFDRPAILHMVKGAADLVYLLVDPYMVHSIPATPPTAGNATTSATSTTQQTPPSPASPPQSSPSSTNEPPPTERERACRIILYQLSKQQAHILYKVKDATRLAIDPSLKLLGCISGKILRIYDTLSKRSKSTFKKQMPYSLYTITFHPIEPYLTLGDEKGHILILHGYNQSASSEIGKKSQKALASGASLPTQELVIQTMHWHAHRLGSVIFTHDGSYMLSAGEEGVLVIWQLETGTKQFLPRLQAGITHISLSHNGNTYALSMNDNRIKFVSAVSNKVEKVIAGLSYSAPAQVLPGGVSYLVSNPSSTNAPAASMMANIARRVYPTDESSRGLSIPFVYSPLHQGWFLSSVNTPGTIQLYDIYSDRSLNELDLLQRANVTSRTDDELNTSQPRLESMSISPRGDKIVTTERRSGNVSGSIHTAGSTTSNGTNDTIVMKFWDWNSHTSSFILNTRIDPPHSHASQHLTLSTLLWHPNPQVRMVVSIGKDACFKIWREIKKVETPNVRKERQYAANNGGSKKGEEAEEQSQEECYWNCTGVGHYRSYPTSSGAFSSDGSLLAVSYGQVLTLWDPYTLTLKHTLLHPSPKHHIRYVAFLPNTPFLLTTTANAMYVWNLLTLSLWWSYDLRVISYAVHERVAPDNTKGMFAVMVLSPEEADATPVSVEKEMNVQPVVVENGDASAATSSSTSSSPSIRKPFKRRSTHLLLFSVHSPVPQRVWPLRDARLDTSNFPNVANPTNKQHHTTTAFTSTILFANDPMVERNNKHKRSAAAGGVAATSDANTGSATSSSSITPTSLIYINYKRQLVRFDDIYEEEPRVKESSHLIMMQTSSTGRNHAEASAQAMARLVSQNEEISLFEQLYGKAHRPNPHNSQQPSSTPAINSLTNPSNTTSNVSLPGRSNISSLLNGPSHILPPPSSLFQSVMDGLMKKQIVAVSGRGTQTASQQQEQQDTEEDVDMTSSSSSQQQQQQQSTSLHSSSHLTPSTLHTDTALLTADTFNGSLFQWETHPLLGAQYTSLAKMIQDPQTKIGGVEVEQEREEKNNSGSSSEKSSEQTTTTTERKRKKGAASSSSSTDEKKDDSSMEDTPSTPAVSTSTRGGDRKKKATESDAMDVDSEQAPQTNGKTKKAKSTKKH